MTTPIPHVDFREILAQPNPTAEAIRALRIEAKLTQLKCADICQVSLSGWKGWETGRRKMSQLAWNYFKIQVTPLIESQDTAPATAPVTDGAH